MSLAHNSAKQLTLLRRGHWFRSNVVCGRGTVRRWSCMYTRAWMESLNTLHLFYCGRQHLLSLLPGITDGPKALLIFLWVLVV